MARRALTLPRLAARLAVVLPFAALLPAACGGSDTIPFDSDGAATLDAARADGSMSDGSLDDSPTGDGTMSDGMGGDGSMTDGTLADATDAADAADALDAADANDALLIADLRLGSAARFAVFAGQSVTNTNATTVTGDLGVYPDPTPIGTTPPTLIGAYHLGDSVAQIAAGDLLTAYTNLTPANMPGCTDLTGTDLGGLTLAPGIYCFSSSAQLTGALVLNAGGNPNAEWFFQIGSTLTTAVLGSVTVIGANPCNVYWQIGSAATLGTNTSFVGNILAFSGVTLNNGTTLTGRALGLAGATVTMDMNVVSLLACPAVSAPLDAGIPDADAGGG